VCLSSCHRLRAINGQAWGQRREALLEWWEDKREGNIP
jgi:hypothetical protein